MTLNVLLSALGGIVVLCAAASRVPPALTDLLRACIPTMHAARELKQAWRTSTTTTPQNPQGSPRPPLPHPTLPHPDTGPVPDDAGTEPSART
jgi:hypothetical protein